MDTKTDTNPPILCVRCGGAGANVYAVGMWTHHFWSDCIEHLTARVEAAEARVAELTTERNTTGRRAFNAEAENQRLAAENRRLSARVAELEAQLAAQGWRPGSETPPPDWYQTVETIEGVFNHAYFDGASWHGYYDNLPPLWYRPILPLPPAPNVQEPTP